MRPWVRPNPVGWGGEAKHRVNAHHERRNERQGHATGHAAFLCADLEISNEPRADHAQYLAHWLDILKADKRAIFRAAADAQRAAHFLHGISDGATVGYPQAA